MNSEIKKLLEYQKIESKLIKIDREIESNPNTAVKNNMVKVVKDSQKLAESLEVEAKASVEEFVKVKKLYEESTKKAEKLSNLNLDSLTDEQLTKLNTELEEILSNLSVVEKKFVAMNKNVEVILEKFEKAKHNAFVAKTNYQNAKTALEKVAGSYLEEQQKLNTALANLKPQINSEIFKKYQQKRQDKVFPVLVPLVDNAKCGACRVDQSKSTLIRLSSNGYCECENCHRIIVEG